MELSDQNFDRLLHLIYETVENQGAWKELYETLAAVLDVATVHVLAFDKKSQALSYSDGANMPAEGELAYLQKYHFNDPRMELLMRLPVLEWMHCHEHFDDAYVAQSPIYQEFLLPFDRRYVSACKVLDGDAATVILAVLRRPAQGPLGNEAVAFLDRLLLHLARACRVKIQNFIYSTQALAGYALVDRLRQPVVLATTDGDVVHANDAATRLLRCTDLVAIRHGKLRMPERAREKFVSQCQELEREMRSGGGEAADKTTAFKSLRIEPPHNANGAATLYAFFTMLVPQQVMGSFGLRPLVLLFFYHPQSTPDADASLLSAAFGLSPAESRIAALLADGLTIKEVANLLEKQEDTVRKQLRSIYQKTATNRQPELIRLLLNLPSNLL